MYIIKFLLLTLIFLPTLVFSASQIPSTGVQTSSENGQPYLVGNSPGISSGAGAFMTITYNKDTSAQVCAGGISTFASWPSTPYDWNIYQDTPIPFSACRTNDTQFIDGNYRTFLCVTSPTYYCNGADWGYSTYPTYSQALSNSQAYYSDFSIIGGVVTPTLGISISSNYDTRFTDYDYSLSSSTLSIDVEYFINLDEIIESQPSKNPTLLGVRYKNVTTDSPYFSQSESILPLNQGTATTTLNIGSMLDGVYIFEVSFSNFPYELTLDQEKKPFKETYIIFEIEIASGTITSSNNDPIYTGQNIVSQSACSNSIIGALCSITSFLFIPTSFTTDYLNSSMDIIKSKKPFSYFTQTADIITTSASSTSSTDFINLEITVYGMTLPIITQTTLDAIYPESTRLYIRSVIAYGLWIAFALTVIYMVLNIFNRVAYQGEQQQSFENRVKSRHEH